MSTNTYVTPISQQVHSELQNALYAGYDALKKAEWKEGTKPQNRQLEAVHNTSAQMDNLYDRMFKYHIPVVRMFNEPCSLTKKCLNYYQIYRKKGLLPLLTKLYPDLGKVVVKKPLIKKSKAEQDEERFILFDHRLMAGRRGEEWNYYELNGSVYKGLSHTPVGRVLGDAELIAMGGGAAVSALANNAGLALLERRRERVERELRERREREAGDNDLDRVLLWDRQVMGDGRRGAHWNWVTIGRDIFKVDTQDQNGFPILSNRMIAALGQDRVRMGADANTEDALRERERRTGSRRMPRRDRPGNVGLMEQLQRPAIRVAAVNPVQGQPAPNAFDNADALLWGNDRPQEQQPLADLPPLPEGLGIGPGDVVVAEADGHRIVQEQGGNFRWVINQ